MPDDDLDHIPSITATRDEAAPPPGDGRRPPGRRRGAARGGNGGGTGSGLLLRLTLVVALVVAAVACAWAWQLQEQLEQAGHVIARHGERLGELEDRLSDTGEGLSQDTAAMAVKIKELYSEVDKLWASAWRRNKAKIEELEQARDSQGGRLETLQQSLGDARTRIQSLSGEVVSLEKTAGELRELVGGARDNREEMQRIADAVNRINLDFSRLEQRIQANEEWINSINAFRRQVNASLTELQAALRELQAQPSAQ